MRFLPLMAATSLAVVAATEAETEAARRAAMPRSVAITDWDPEERDKVLGAEEKHPRPRADSWINQYWPWRSQSANSREESRTGSISTDKGSSGGSSRENTPPGGNKRSVRFAKEE